MPIATAVEHQLRAENRSLDARLGEAIRVEEGLRADAIRERERNWQAVLLLRRAIQMLRGGNCCDGEDATMSDESKRFQAELAAYLETFEEPERGDPDWRNG
jgi:hypothetical protein